MSTPASALVSPKDLLMPSTSIMAPRPGEWVVVVMGTSLTRKSRDPGTVPSYAT